jgi:hypothetical protein
MAGGVAKSSSSQRAMNKVTCLFGSAQFVWELLQFYGRIAILYVGSMEQGKRNLPKQRLGCWISLNEYGWLPNALSHNGRRKTA